MTTLTKSAPSANVVVTPPPQLLGRQEPRLSLIPAYRSTAGGEAIDVYELTGNRLNDWQKFVLNHSLGERDDGRWAAFEIGLIVARQNGKDEVLIARELAGLFVWGEQLIIHSAHKFDTAMEHLERLVGLIENVPEFSRRVRKVNRSHGSEGITLKSGARIRFRARTRSGGARGYTGDCVIFNEAMELPDEIVGSMMPTMAARSMLIPGPQIWLAGSAVDQATMANGLVLTRVRNAGINGTNDRLAFFEWSAEDDADPESWGARAAANPSLGLQISPEHVETEWRSPSMSTHQFNVERLGKGDWPEIAEGAGQIIDKDFFQTLGEDDRSNKIVSKWAIGVDCSVDQTWSSIGIAGLRADDVPQGAVVRHDRGDDWVVDHVQLLKNTYKDAPVALDKRGPAAHLIPVFKEAGIEVIEMSTQDVGDAFANFMAAIARGRKGFRYPAPQPDLDAARAAARKQAMGDRWKWGRRASTGDDISPIVAVNWAFWAIDKGTVEARKDDWMMF